MIVPVRNGADDIAALLECLANQTLPRDQFELVVADDGSTDGGTDEVATADGHVRVVEGPPPNAYAARNRAVAHRGPVLAFCDADCRPEPEWLERGIAALEQADIIAGRIRMHMPSHPSVWALLDAESTKDHEHQVAWASPRPRTFSSAESSSIASVASMARTPGTVTSSSWSAAFRLGRLWLTQRRDRLASRADSGRALLRNVWAKNHSYARSSRSGRLPEESGCANGSRSCRLCGRAAIRHVHPA